MTRTRLAARDIIQIEDSFYFKGNMTPTFDKRQVSTRVGDFGKLNNCDAFDVHKMLWVDDPGIKSIGFRLSEFSVIPIIAVIRTTRTISLTLFIPLETPEGKLPFPKSNFTI